MNLSNEKILVTGSSGLLGRSLVSHLEAIGASIYTFRSKEYSLEDQEQTKQLFQKYNDTTVVFHLAAAVGGIIAHKENKADYYFRNSMINGMVMHYAHKYCKNIKKVCLVSSACVYPADLPLPLTETNIWGGFPEPNVRIYGLVKRMLEVQSMAYKDQYNLSSVVVLPSNSYGPHDNFSLRNSHVIPGIIRKIHDAHINDYPSVNLFGTGKPTRDFIYVSDVSKAMIALTENYSSCVPVNIGSGQETSIETIAYKVKEIIGYKGEILFDSTFPDGQSRKYLNIEKLKSIIGDFPCTTIEEGLKQTIDWYINASEVRKD